MKRWPALGLLLLLLAMSAVLPARAALADGEAAAATPTMDVNSYTPEPLESALPSSEPSTTGMLLDVLWKLGLVVLCVYGVFWVMRRVSVRRVAPGGRQLQVMETVSLGANRSLHLVRVGGQTLLLGTTAQEVRNLADVTDALGGDDAWAELEAVPEPSGGDGEHDDKTLTPSFEAIARVRRLWRRSEQ